MANILSVFKQNDHLIQISAGSKDLGIFSTRGATPLERQAAELAFAILKGPLPPPLEKPLLQILISMRKIRPLDPTSTRRVTFGGVEILTMASHAASTPHQEAAEKAHSSSSSTTEHTSAPSAPHAAFESKSTS